MPAPAAICSASSFEKTLLHQGLVVTSGEAGETFDGLGAFESL
jgi:hypothetical protein